MALYALGDLHLSFQSDKSMDKFGKVWRHHDRKIEKYVRQIVKPEDTLVLTGDHPGAENWRIAGRIWRLLKGSRAVRYSCGATMICSGTPKDLPAERTIRRAVMFLQNNFYAYEDCAWWAQRGTATRAGYAGAF